MVGRVGSVLLAAAAAALLPGTARGQATGSGQDVSRILCESAPGQRQACPVSTARGVTLVEETGTSPCLLGNTWGYDASGIWVRDGCGGRFAAGEAPAASGSDDGILRKFQPYGRFLGQLAYFDDDFEVQDNASWLGMKFATGEKIQFVAHAEFGVSLVGQADRFRAGTRTDAGYLTLERLDDPPVLGNRLGYVGVDFGNAGRVTIGKDWGVHYDIAAYTTDRWNAFGGQGSLAYPGGGDGGLSGTGRANQVLRYRVTVARILEIGAQTQFNNTGNNDAFDGFGGSLQVTVLPGLKLGAAYTQIDVTGEIPEDVAGLDGDSKYWIAGASFTSDVLDVGAVYSGQENGDLRSVPEPGGGEDALLVPFVFDGNGIEIYARAKLGRFGINGGFIDYDPDTGGALIDPDFRTRYFILGADWRLADGAWAYTEFRIDDSVEPDGSSGTDVAVLGFKYQFSWNSTHNP